MVMEVSDKLGKYDEIEIYLTGFGPFDGVENNPTMKIIPLVSINAERVSVKARDILEVCINAVQDYVDGLTSEKKGEKQADIHGCDNNTNEDPGSKDNKAQEQSKRKLTLLISLGVSKSSHKIRIEECYYNRADFNYPDVDGNQPFNQKISNHYPLDEQFFTKLDVYKVNDTLKNAGRDVAVSFDPGRYVCNYLYCYAGLALKDEADFFNVFVHVPPLEVLPLMEQVETIQDLIMTVASMYLAKTDA